jgi:hypothetical protein
LTVPGRQRRDRHGNGFDTIVISAARYRSTNALASLSYRGNPDFNGTDTLTVITSDGSLSDTDNGRDHGNPGERCAGQRRAGRAERQRGYHAGNRRRVGSDVDNLALTTTLTVASGTLNVATGGGATIGGNGTAAVTISGTKNQINSSLAA